MLPCASWIAQEALPFPTTKTACASTASSQRPWSAAGRATFGSRSTGMAREPESWSPMVGQHRLRAEGVLRPVRLLRRVTGLVARDKGGRIPPSASSTRHPLRSPYARICTRYVYIEAMKSFTSMWRTAGSLTSICVHAENTAPRRPELLGPLSIACTARRRSAGYPPHSHLFGTTDSRSGAMLTARGVRTCRSSASRSPSPRSSVRF